MITYSVKIKWRNKIYVTKPISSNKDVYYPRNIRFSDSRRVRRSFSNIRRENESETMETVTVQAPIIFITFPARYFQRFLIPFDMLYMCWRKFRYRTDDSFQSQKVIFKLTRTDKRRLEYF